MIINKSTSSSYLIATLILCSLSESNILLSKNARRPSSRDNCLYNFFVEDAKSRS